MHSSIHVSVCVGRIAGPVYAVGPIVDMAGAEQKLVEPT
jgi:hypothetical protein